MLFERAQSSDVIENSSSKGFSHLRQHWSDERAYRTGKALTRATLVLTTIAFLLNLKFASNAELAADLVMISSCLLTIALTRRKKPRRYFVWWPLYVGFCIAIIPSTWLSGGIKSPWLGLYLACMIMLGSVIQTRIKPIYHILFVFLNVLLWTIMGHFFPFHGEIPYPLTFIAVSTVLGLLGIGYCIHELIRTERDLSLEIERRYSELYEAREKLLREEHANQSKSAFLANVSHELRTPLGAILGYASLLHDETTSQEDKIDFAKTIERNGHQLARLVDDILDLAKVEAGCIELEKVACRPRDVINDVIQLLNANVKNKNIRLTTRFGPEVPISLFTDPLRFKQILTNLLSNAIKFTEQGEIEVRAGYSDQRKIFVSVRDSGCGLTDAEKERLFKPFSQAGASTARRYGGTGLGLNFSRQLARLMGGDLNLTWSEPQKGSEFTFHIPAAPAVDNLSSEDLFHPSPVHFNFQNLKILLADDSAEIRDLVLRYLSPTGAQLAFAVDGRECLRLAKKNHFDLILMDIQMPEMDGLTATAHLRANAYTGPIIALTAHAMKEDKDRCLKAGCSAHLPKPLDKHDLLEIIHHFGFVKDKLYSTAPI